jgi:hypothetical protein
LYKVVAAYPGASLGAYIILLCGIGLIANALGYVRLPAPASARA